MTSEEAVKIVKKNDAPYLNSKARVAKKILISLLEYVVIILLTLMLASYMESGTIDNMFSMNESMMEMLQPGGFIFNSLVAYLPILILVNLPTKNSPPGRHGQEGCFQSIRFTIPAAWRSVLEIQRSESENLLGFCHIPQILPSGTWRLLLRSPPLHPAPTEHIRRF